MCLKMMLEKHIIRFMWIIFIMNEKIPIFCIHHLCIIITFIISYIPCVTIETFDNKSVFTVVPYLFCSAILINLYELNHKLGFL